MESIQC
jgi:hypothetical protein